jgi:hypothetical protein
MRRLLPCVLKYGLLLAGLAILVSSFVYADIPGPVDRRVIASGVTTDTTTAAVRIVNGYKSIYGQVVCTSGACTQTQAIYGDIDDDKTNGILLCTLTLSGTPRAQDACPPFTANFVSLYVVTTATTGTGATGAVYAMY